MNMPATGTQVQAASAYPTPQVRPSATVSLFDETRMAALYRFAELMSKGISTVPTHLRGNVGDCMAVCMAAQRWGMDPFVVAQKTHSVNGTLGYEGQLVGALINTSASLQGRLNFKWFGPWEKIVGKFKWLESKTKKDAHGQPSRYAVPAWDSNKDEEGLGVECFGTIVGETEPRVLSILMLQARTRNSTLWAEDPKQQIAYLAEKRWARLHMPEVLLGVYTPDELAAPRDMGMAEVVEPVDDAGPTDALLQAARDAADGGRVVFGPWWNQLLPAQRRTLQNELDDLATRTKAADDRRTVDNGADPVQAPAASPVAPAASAAPAAAPTDATPRTRPRAPAPRPAAAPAPAAAVASTGAPKFTAEQVRDRLANAPDVDALYIAADLINVVEDEAARPALEALFEERKETFE